MNYIIEGELVDTYGGDYTFRDVWYEDTDNGRIYYESFHGAKALTNLPIRIDDEDEIEYLKTLIDDE